MSEIGRIPAEAVHPTEYILEELEARGWTLDDLAAKTPGDFGLNRLAMDFYLLQDEGVRLGEAGAEGLAAAFGTSKELWLNLERAWLDWKRATRIADEGTRDE